MDETKDEKIRRLEAELEKARGMHGGFLEEIVRLNKAIDENIVFDAKRARQDLALVEAAKELDRVWQELDESQGPLPLPERFKEAAHQVTDLALGLVAASADGPTCSSAGHEREPAAGEAQAGDIEDSRWYPYCEECCETFERAGGTPVRRWQQFTLRERQLIANVLFGAGEAEIARRFEQGWR